MSDYLGYLATRSLDQGEVILPRLPARFELTHPVEDGASSRPLYEEQGKEVPLSVDSDVDALVSTRRRMPSRVELFAEPLLSQANPLQDLSPDPPEGPPVSSSRQPVSLQLASGLLPVVQEMPQEEVRALDSEQLPSVRAIRKDAPAITSFHRDPLPPPRELEHETDALLRSTSKREVEPEKDSARLPHQVAPTPAETQSQQQEHAAIILRNVPVHSAPPMKTQQRETEREKIIVRTVSERANLPEEKQLSTPPQPTAQTPPETQPQPVERERIIVQTVTERTVPLEERTPSRLASRSPAESALVPLPPVPPTAIVVRPHVAPAIELKTPTQTEPTATPKPESTIQVTIGRIEVRATPSTTPRPQKQRSTPPVMGLDEYLRRRAEGGGR